MKLSRIAAKNSITSVRSIYFSIGACPIEKQRDLPMSRADTSKALLFEIRKTPEYWPGEGSARRLSLPQGRKNKNDSNSLLPRRLHAKISTQVSSGQRATSFNEVFRDKTRNRRTDQSEDSLTQLLPSKKDNRHLLLLWQLFLLLFSSFPHQGGDSVL